MAHNGQRLRGLLVRSCTALVLLATPAFAADDPQQPGASQPSPPSMTAPSSPDFLIGRPRAVVGVRGGWMMASAGSDLFDFVTEQLTLEKSNFNTGSFAAELGLNVTPRLDLVFGVDTNRSRTPSEYRDFIDNRGAPIEQVTALSQTNLTASIKFAVLPKGRQISRLAWIPRTVVPYVGAGAGMGKYAFTQNGDFVDYADFGVFADSFRSEGWTPVAHIFGGTDIQVFRRMLLSLEARYNWANAELDRDFVGFAPLDLGGLKFGAGVHFVF